MYIVVQRLTINEKKKIFLGPSQLHLETPQGAVAPSLRATGVGNVRYGHVCHFESLGSFIYYACMKENKRENEIGHRWV